MEVVQKKKKKKKLVWGGFFSGGFSSSDLEDFAGDFPGRLFCAILPQRTW